MGVADVTQEQWHLLESPCTDMLLTMPDSSLPTVLGYPNLILVSLRILGLLKVLIFNFCYYYYLFWWYKKGKILMCINVKKYEVYILYVYIYVNKYIKCIYIYIKSALILS